MAHRLYDSVKAYVPKDLRARLSRLAWDALDLHWTLPTGGVVRVHDLAEWRTYNEIFVDQDYDAAIGRALDLRDGGQRFNALDLGANVGFFTQRLLHLARAGGRLQRPLHVVAVEGSSEVARRLRASIADAHLEPSSSVTIVEGLAGRRAGSAVFQEGRFHVMNRASDEGEGRRVGYVDLDQATADCDAIHLLKCDVEGSEQAFVTEYPRLLQRTSVAVFELHERLCDTRAAVETLRAYGFRQRGDKRVAPDCSLAWFENERVR